VLILQCSVDTTVECYYCSVTVDTTVVFVLTVEGLG
jgi:hypothetical protein